MRKNYVKPALISEEFVPQTYVAACEHTSSGAGMYKFVCDAGGGASGDLYDINMNNLTGPGDTYSSYSACNKTHEAPTTDVFFDGYFIKNGGNNKLTYQENVGSFWNPEYVEKEYEKTKVIIWTGDGDIHATENLNQDTWQKNIS